MPREDPTHTEHLKDPLSEVTRKERRTLLAVSMVGIFISHTGSIPKELSALGIKLAASEQTSFLLLGAVVVLYFVVAFVLYGASDFMIWRKTYQDYLRTVELNAESWAQDAEEIDLMIGQSLPDISWLYQWSKPTAYVRAFFEYGLPILVGLYSLVSLAWAASRIGE